MQGASLLLIILFPILKFLLASQPELNLVLHQQLLVCELLISLLLYLLFIQVLLLLFLLRLHYVQLLLLLLPLDQLHFSAFNNIVALGYFALPEFLNGIEFLILRVL